MCCRSDTFWKRCKQYSSAVSLIHACTISPSSFFWKLHSSNECLTTMWYNFSVCAHQMNLAFLDMQKKLCVSCNTHRNLWKTWNTLKIWLYTIAESKRRIWDPAYRVASVCRAMHSSSLQIWFLFISQVLLIVLPCCLSQTSAFICSRAPSWPGLGGRIAPLFLESECTKRHRKVSNF